MISNVYLTTGSLDGELFMKIGKANSIEQREDQIHIRILHWLPCDSEVAAFYAETALRKAARKLGAHLVPERRDWFYFDAGIYEELRWKFIELLCPNLNENFDLARNILSLMLEIEYLSGSIDHEKASANRLASGLKSELKMWQKGWRPPAGEGE